VADTTAPSDPPETLRPAFYAGGAGGWSDWWTLLHPPYTAWHLAYAVIGACLAPQVRTDRLVATVLGFFLAVGVAAHALDEVNGRPLKTGIPTQWLVVAATLSLGGAVALGAVGVGRVGLALLPFIALGPILVVAYNLDFRAVHKDVIFAASWGAFPILTAYVAQTGRISWSAVLAAIAAFALSIAQRCLSAPARRLRRQSLGVTGKIRLVGGEEQIIDRATLLAPLERALQTMAFGLVVLAAALAVARLA
jgi:hypothetical protein